MRLETTSNNSLLAYFQPSPPDEGLLLLAPCAPPSHSQRGLCPAARHGGSQPTPCCACCTHFPNGTSIFSFTAAYCSGTAIPNICSTSGLDSSGLCKKEWGQETDAGSPLLLQERSGHLTFPRAQGQPYRRVLRRVWCSPVRFLGASGSVWSPPGLHTPPMP